MNPRKRFGQHFLRDADALRNIVAAVAPRPGESVLEIGPGDGALTAELIRSGANVSAVEIDRDLCAKLRARFGDDLRLIEGDALQVDLRNPNGAHDSSSGLHRSSDGAHDSSSGLHRSSDGAHDSSTGMRDSSDGAHDSSTGMRDSSDGAHDSDGSGSVDATPRMVGNLPYNISTPLLMRMLAARPPDIHAMTQLEVATRLQAPPGASDYGRLSVVAQSLCEIEILFPVPRESFWPVPKVDSAFIRMLPRPDASPPPPNLDAILRSAFSRRRKTLANALPEWRVDWESINIPPSRRPQTLSPQEFAALARSATPRI